MESFVSTVCGVVWWALRLSVSAKRLEDGAKEWYMGIGLQSLASTPEKEKLHDWNQTSGIVHSHSRKPSFSSSHSFKSLPTLSRSSSFSSSMTGDLVGTESGVYMTSDCAEDLLPLTGTTDNGKPYTKKPCCIDKRTTEYPPTISVLARPGDLPGHKPFGLSREYVDGRLILTEERPEQGHRVYAGRENGHLLLYLVPPVREDEFEDMGWRNDDLINDGEMEEMGVEFVDSDIYDAVMNEIRYEVVDEMNAERRELAMLSSSMPESGTASGSVEGGGGRRCFTYVGGGISDTNFFNFPTIYT